MTVKEIFQLRREGKFEEAYKAIRPIYARYRGKYTTLCMFWTAHDIFNLRLANGEIGESKRILEALKRVLVNMDDKDGRAAAFIKSAESRIEKADELAWERAEEESETYDVSCIDEYAWMVEGLIKGKYGAQKGRHDPKSDLTAVQLKVLEYIEDNEGCTVPRIHEDIGIPCKSLERHISALRVKGLIRHSGSKKAGGYYVVNRRALRKKKPLNRE